MSGAVKNIDEIKLSSAENGVISVNAIAEPYGVGSESVVSIGIFLDGSGNEPDWKIHIPKDNIDSVIAALQKAKENL